MQKTGKYFSLIITGTNKDGSQFRYTRTYDERSKAQLAKSQAYDVVRRAGGKIENATISTL